MRCDQFRRVLVVLVAGLIFLPSTLFPQQTSSPARSVRLSYVSGKVMVKPAGASAATVAQANTILTEGCEVSTSVLSLATVTTEDGSKIRLGVHTKVVFTALSADAQGHRLSQIKVEQGTITFDFNPGPQDTYKVQIGDVTFTPAGKAQFRTVAIKQEMQVQVGSGSVIATSGSSSMTLEKGRVLEFAQFTPEQLEKSRVRVVRVSFATGTLTVKRPNSTQWENASVNTPLQEGFELSTGDDSYAEVEFENGSTARLGENSKILFHQLGLSAVGAKLNGMTFEQGYATFNVIPETFDTYQVKVGDATVMADGKTEFRTDLEEERFRVEVFQGSVNVVAAALSAKVDSGKILERQIGSPESAFNIHKGIEKDAWDKWTEARDLQAQRTLLDQSVKSPGLAYGWGEPNTYGEWVNVPGRGLAWAPYVQLGWAPYTSGRWVSYPGFGYVWVSNEPWGWLPYHCGKWFYDATLGWYWMPIGGCMIWQPSLVTWYMGGEWIGWSPGEAGGGSAPTRPTSPTPTPPTTPPKPPGPPKPPTHPWPVRPSPAQPGKGGTGLRRVTTVPVSVVQNGEPITPKMVNRTLVSADSRIANPPFEPTPHPVAPSSIAGAGGAAPTHEPKAGVAPSHASAPSIILMGGDPKKESALLSGIHFHPEKQPLRVRDGISLGGSYVVSGSRGEFRGEVIKEAQGSKGGGVVATSGGSGATRSSSGHSGGFIVSHTSSGGATRGGGGATSGGGSRSGGGGGVSSGSGHVSSGGTASSGGGAGRSTSSTSSPPVHH